MQTVTESDFLLLFPYFCIANSRKQDVQINKLHLLRLWSAVTWQNRRKWRQKVCPSSQSVYDFLETIPLLLLPFRVLGIKPIHQFTIHSSSFFLSTIQRDSLSAIHSMTSLLMSKERAKNTTDVPLITKSAQNLGSCLNNMLKAGAEFATGSSGYPGIDQVRDVFCLQNCL